jgi:hypothetical protein
VAPSKKDAAMANHASTAGRSSMIAGATSLSLDEVERIVIKV